MPIDPAMLKTLADEFRDVPGGLMPALHALQDRVGHVPDDAVPVLAATFNLSRAEVHGVLTYYHHFRREPAGRHVLQVCQAEACQAMGAVSLMDHASRQLACPREGRSADGRFTLEAAYCLGLCASSPAALLDGRPHARLTPERLDALIAPLQAEAA